MCMVRCGGIMRVLIWIHTHVKRGLDEETIVYLSMPIVSVALLIRRYQFFLPWSRYLIWWRGVRQSMGYIGRVVHLGTVRVHLWSMHQGSVTWRDQPMILLHACVYYGVAIFRRWVSIFMWWVDWPIFNTVFLLLMQVKYVYCVRAKDVGITPKIIEDQTIQRMSEYRVSYGHYVRSFLSTAIYKSASAKRITISGSVFWASIHFHSASTNAFHWLQLPSWVHWYRCCIVFGVSSQRGNRLVVACPFCCRIIIVGRVLLMHFTMKCSMWAVVVSRDCLNNLGSISSQSDVWVRFWSFQCWSIRCLEILYAIDWEMLEWNGYPCVDMLGIPYGYDSPIVIVFIVADESINAAMICSDISSSIMLRDANGVKVDAGIPLLWCLWTCTRDMSKSIDW